MTDNRTTELREKLTKCGVKWWPMHNNGYYEDRDTEFVANGKKHTAHEWGDGLAVYNLTPEQAIAATLGNEREKELETLARDMFAYIDKCCESDLSFGCVDPVDCAYYDKARDWCTKASSIKQRMKELGIKAVKR